MSQGIISHTHKKCNAELSWENIQRMSYQLLLSTASPNPGVSTIVSSNWTPPSLIKTFDCSTCKMNTARLNF